MENKEKDLLLDEELEEGFDELEAELEAEDVEIVELTDDKGDVLKFFNVGETVYNEKRYAFFMPAEEIEGLGEDEVVIFEVGCEVEGKEELLPVEDHALLECIYEQFCREMDEEVSALEAEELEGEGCCCGHHHHEEDEECCCGHHHHHDGEECDCHHDGEELCHCHGDEKGHKKGECKGKHSNKCCHKDEE